MGYYESKMLLLTLLDAERGVAKEWHRAENYFPLPQLSRGDIYFRYRCWDANPPHGQETNRSQVGLVLMHVDGNDDLIRCKPPCLLHDTEALVKSGHPQKCVFQAIIIRGFTNEGVSLV